MKKLAKIFTPICIIKGLLLLSCISPEPEKAFMAPTICTQPDLIALPVSEASSTATKLFVLPHELVASPLAQEMQKQGWKILDAKEDSYFNTIFSGKFALVIFYSTQALDTKLFQQNHPRTFISILVTNKVKSEDAFLNNEFTKWGDAVFSADDVNFTNQVEPKRITCFSYSERRPQIDAPFLDSLALKTYKFLSMQDNARPALVPFLSTANIQINETYVINLDRSPERMRFQTEQLNKAVIPFRRQKGIDGKKDLNIDALKISGVIQLWPGAYTGFLNTTPQGRYLSAGEVGNYLSHRSIWIDMLQNQVPVALVLEDDAVVPPSIKEQLENVLPFVPTDWDLIYLGCNASSEWGCNPNRLPTIADGRLIVMNDTCIAANNAYIINQKAARVMVKNALPLTEPTDLFVQKRILSGNAGPFHSYCVNPELISPHPDMGSIIFEYGRTN